MSGDDNFYSRMAAEAADSDSDISAADPAEISNLADLDVLDAGLFSNKKDSKSAKPAVTAEKKAAVVPPKSAAKEDSYVDDFDDDINDMIDGILEDDDDFGAKKKKKKEEPAKPEVTVPESPTSPDISAPKAFEPLKTAPAAVAPAPVVKRRKEAVTFSSDEDDLLPETKQLKAPPASVRPRKGSADLLEEPGEETRPARSVLDSLLSKPKAVAELEQPKEKKEFTLDTKYTGGKGAGDLGDDSDFWSSSTYRPSTAAVKTKRRSVHFEDEDDAGFAEVEKPRPVTAPASRRSAGRGGGGWLGLGDDDSVDLDASVKPTTTTASKPKKKPDLNQTAPAALAPEVKFVSRFEAEAEAKPAVQSASPKGPPPPALETRLVSKKQKPVFGAKAEAEEAPRKEEVDFSFGLDSSPNSELSSSPALPLRQRRTSGSPEGRGAPRRPAAGSGRRMAELFKAERQEEQSVMPGNTPFVQPVTPPQVAFGAAADSRVVMELENKIKRMEMEKEHLNSLMQMLKTRHEDELRMIEESHKSKSEIQQETYRLREQRYKEENALLNEQARERLKMAEKEREELRAEQSRRLEESQREKERELARLREQHRGELAEQRNEHQKALESLRLAQLREQEAVRDVQPTAASIQGVIDQLASKARGLDSLSKEVGAEARANQQEREAALRAKDEQLRALADRLRLQDEETSRERQRLQDLVAKMDAQLREQSRAAEEEKWSAKQQEARLEAQQKALDEERRSLMENSRREHESVERAKAAVLSEQKTLLAQLFEERKSLAEERAQLNSAQSAWLAKQQQNSTRSLQSEANLEGQAKSIIDERRRLDALELELREAKEDARRQKSAADRERQALEAERRRLEGWEAELRRREAAAEERWAESEEHKRRSEGALMEAKRMRDDQEQRLSSIQSQLNQMRQKEKHLTQDRLLLAKQRQDLERTSGSLLCSNCELPVRDMAVRTAPLGASLPLAAEPGAARAMRRSQEVAEALELDRQRRQLQLEAERDADFLREEGRYLEQLQRASTGAA